ncbi:MAG: CBS domain-containing protein [Sulfitobacter sp.]|nr:CBS domain-containing protein [Sulfitobacter sp.]
MNASDIMTKTVITGQPGTTVAQAADLMTQNRISAIPVLNKNVKIVGIVSEGDLLRRVEGAQDRTRSWWLSLFSYSTSSARGFIQERGQHLENIMTTQVTTIAVDMPVGQIAQLLDKKHIKRVPVVEDEKLVGIGSRANLLQALAAQPIFHIGFEADEGEKRNIVLGTLANVPGLNPVHLNVVVSGNRVDVWGIVNSNDEEAAAVVAMDATEGLGEVSMHLGRIPNYAWGI